MHLKAILAATFALMLSGPAAAAQFAANKIVFQDVTGSVEIVTTSGSEIDVQIRQGGTHRTVEVSEKDGVVTVKGEKWREEEHHDCCNDRIRRSFHPRHGRQLTAGEALDEGFFNDYPTIVVTMPRRGDATFVDARIKLAMQSLDGALHLDACFVYGETGDVQEARLDLLGGSRLVVGDVGAGLDVNMSGDADLRTGSAAIANFRIAGPGDAYVGEIAGMLDVSIAGSGIVRAARLDGPLTARIAGSGAVDVQGGRADRLRAIIDGSGGVYFNGVAVSPDLRLFGSSEVKMASVSGRITRAGAGEVYVGGNLVARD